MKVSESRKVDRYHIYVGLNLAMTNEQRFDTEKYVALVDYICRNNVISYTLGTVRGGYRSDSGAYVNENSLDLMLIDADPETVHTLASELCAMLSQECVLITHDQVEMYYLSDRIEKE